MVKNASNEIKKLESLKDLIKLCEKYNVLVINMGMVTGSNCMYVTRSGNKY